MFVTLVKSAIRRVLLLVVCWWALTEGDSSAWAFGIPVILIALASSILINPSTRGRIHSLPGFAGFFLWHSLLGGIDVARRALHPKMPLAPALIDFPLRLDDQAAITLLIYTINLLPGTIVVEFEERRLGIHVLDRRLPVFESLRTVETRVAVLFGFQLTDMEDLSNA
ncbi:multicomponent Na+:H+ antiporter subunit E [Methylocaldum szegediense]|uniref:Multicomponent Na+:H+ antiporter subunit E n=2 Tax=Methylocaldum szegediense TaxID=73780 RepID=A0ABM9HZW9_9GAMM|nr:Na+/H+ antiporter subunit E [Methylocaldum szegediense]CAI8798455.1 multicomponent Na+:H+ antiporter subunit E [Methylocaldum szegediense]